MDRNERDPYPRLDFVIAKYNLAKYDSWGTYTDDSEWTSIEDAVTNGLDEEYLITENAYVYFFKSVLEAKNCQRLVIHMWSGFNDAAESSEMLDTCAIYKRCKHLKDYSVVGIQTACDLLRLSLRAVLDCSLVNMSHGVEFMVGYEFYLHLRCSEIDYRFLELLAEHSGLYLNPREKVSTKDIKYDKLLGCLKDVKSGDMMSPKLFGRNAARNYVYETLFLSDTVLSNKKPGLKTAIILPKPSTIKGIILSWHEIEPFLEEAKLLFFQFGRKVRIGEDAILIDNRPMEWKEYRSKNKVYLIYL